MRVRVWKCKISRYSTADIPPRRRTSDPHANGLQNRYFRLRNFSPLVDYLPPSHQRIATMEPLQTAGPF